MIITNIKPSNRRNAKKNDSGALSSEGWKTANALVPAVATTAIVAATTKMMITGITGLANRVSIFISVALDGLIVSLSRALR